MLRIINQIGFNCVVSGELMAFQIAELLNNNNKLRRRHNSYTIKSDNGYYLVYYDDGRVVGCTAIKAEHPTLTRNYHTSVDINYRGKGIGTLLIDTAIAESKTDYMFITVRKDNNRSIRLYKKKNFVYVKDESPELITMGRRN